MRARVAVGLLLLMTGCAPTPEPPAPPPSSTSPPAVPAHGAPRVVNPLSADDVVADPCSLVDTAQAKAIGVRDPGRRVADDRCEWTSSAADADVAFTVRVRASDGLTGYYRLAEQDTYPLWEPIPDLAGQPAVMHNALIPGGGYDGCAIAVGLRDDVAVDVELLWSPAPPYRDLSVCTEVQRHARDLVTALR